MDIEKENKRLKLEVFQYKMLLNARSVILHFLYEGIPITEFLNYMDERTAVKEPYGKEAPPLPSKVCEDCLSPMTLLEVNISKATLTGEATDQTVWLCKNQECLNAIYNKETYKEIVGGIENGKS